MCAQNLYRDKGRKKRPPENSELCYSIVRNKARRGVIKRKQVEILKVKMMFKVDKMNPTLDIKGDPMNWKILVRKPPRTEQI